MKIKVYGYWQRMSGVLFSEYTKAQLGEHVDHTLRYRATHLGVDTLECETCDVRLWGEPVEEVDL